ncbi:MAG: SDR family NAD(P)-dependent oxidoreductase, partial [Dialister sp.]|nr:SDR family NAD(P)-dependent oxidoreductase [Dialister sp.]
MHKNKVALISGGTSGIGLATAKILSEEGWKTVLLGRDKQKG